MKLIMGQQITTVKRVKGVVVATNFSRSKPLLVRFSETNYEALTLNEIKQ